MFVRYISHEVRTPLNTAIAGLQVLIESLVRKEDLDIVEVVKKSCDNAVSVLNEFLTFDKLEGGTLMIENTRVPAYKLIEDSVTPFQVQVSRAEMFAFFG